MENTFIEFADYQVKLYWLGLPYIVESAYRGRFYNVMNLDETTVDEAIEGKVLHKFFKMVNSDPKGYKP